MPRKTKIAEYEGTITDAQVARAERQTIREIVPNLNIDLDMLEGQLENVIITLQEALYECITRGYTNVVASLEGAVWDHGPTSVNLYGERVETDADVRRRLATRKIRLEENKKYKKEQAQYERNILEKLANKFNKTIINK